MLAASAGLERERDRRLLVVLAKARTHTPREQFGEERGNDQLAQRRCLVILGTGACQHDDVKSHTPASSRRVLPELCIVVALFES